MRILFCGHIGIEYLHLANDKRESFIENKLEKVKLFLFITFVKFYSFYIFLFISKDNFISNDEKKDILKLILKAELFEIYLGKRFSGAKRFSLEGKITFIGT